MRPRFSSRAVSPASLLVLAAVVVHPLAAQDPPEEDELPACRAGDGGSLEGVVVDRATGVPLPGADVEVIVDGRTERHAATERGRFRVCGVPPAAPVEASAAFRSISSPTRAVTGGNDGRPLRLEIDLGTPANIVVAVTDAETGDPVEGVTIRLQPGVIGGVTSEVGRVGLGSVPPGGYRLRADHLAYHAGEGEVFVDPGRDRQLDVRLERRILVMDTLNVRIAAGECARPGYTTVSGKVVDRETGIPLEGAIVSASRFEDGGLVDERAQTDEEGTFFFCGMPLTRRYRLAASFEDRRSDGVVVETGRERGAIVLEIDQGDPGVVALQVTDASTGAPVSGAMVRLDPHPLGGLTDERGRAGWRGIPPGEYEVRVDHIAFASFEGIMEVGDRSAEEYAIELQPTAIAVEPIEVRVTGRDPYLLETGFYDRMRELEEGYFYDYWDVEPYALLSTFMRWKGLLRPPEAIFINGRPMSRIGYESVDEIPFGEIRGAELIRCPDLPEEMARYFDLFELNSLDCWAALIWRGARRVRSEREPPTDRCANERRAERLCTEEEG